MKLAERWDAISDWLNTDITIRRIDLVMGVCGVFCVALYGYLDGLRGAVIGGGVYLLVLMVTLWLI